MCFFLCFFLRPAINTYIQKASIGFLLIIVLQNDLTQIAAGPSESLSALSSACSISSDNISSVIQIDGGMD